ncbi:bifunctional [glutamate--ammonia ligase]-adenylyl-L-tyrosine phosphorylase/[glutamate--ammonia-ligase] adenylyltransferase [Natronospira bacteriovora]|uniref:Bifunctional glutamine synthetase adenylyltransferase/adenylyl-removing enzyme n=1 Tax=Natronospira bacteriovora TaxID=3069753 RepID=A0ABU0W6G5_9GAMM|nr:bifunctional [glutamate--ammonia ligase]-adenylyl-L-tyrosine phosphorylase/[glutamate--ammonia-ligase] adenylyltransferase [Natronospira sp. AB-CW4]MDQ2069622.1 bifunctional [glutamate--ammonia ligase]-adenylyl-L-tyrosine phosphorylase/[glutamate--ammonia-ligase] adenylyltransferase [Natronospira sp. AB-CW4]
MNDTPRLPDWLSDAQRTQLGSLGLESLLSCSPYVQSVLRRDEGLLDWLEQAQGARTADGIRARWQHLLESEDEAAVMAGLRVARNREMVLTLWRDISGQDSLSDTLGALTALADALIGLAHDWSRARLLARHGCPRNGAGKEQSLIVLGLGKLGGGELNFSSDVDLIFAFPEGGETDGERALDNETFFTRLGRQIIRLLDEVTADGQVYRVDMRLRPFGASGPLVMNFSGIETYYQLHGREWERYALIKARPVAGDIQAGESLLRELQPFVYRRYLDYSVFGSLRDMKQGIRREVRRKGLEDNIKLGRGGIREIEFIVQLFQLIRGGREAELRQRSLRSALEGAVQNGHIAAADGERLQAHYDFLRRLENRIQGLHDAQTHDLPDDAADRERLLAMMGMRSWPELENQVAEVRREVGEAFDDVFVGPALPEEQAAGNAFDDLWRDRLDEAAAEKLLRRTGFADAARVRDLLSKLRESRPVQRMGERGRKRIDRLMPSVLLLAASKDNAEATLQRMASVVEAIATRTAYLALLVENPRALEHLGRLCAASPWAAERIARHPLLLDELIDPRIFQESPEPEAYARELDELLNGCGDDLERLMDALREFQQATVLRVVAADIAGALEVGEVSDRLTLLAELILQRVLGIARRALVERHGHPRCEDPDAREPGFIIVAYGKLGSIELAYGSDLDLVFLHDSRGEAQQTDGERSVDNGLFFARLAQRIIHQLATPTPAGRLYEVDTRLRPSGASGLLVSGLEAFVDYQREKAWTWEHQALMRARPVAGDEALQAAFREARQAILCRARDHAGLKKDIVAMRERMLAEQTSGDGADLKRSSGGLVDAEFLVQYWALAHAAEHPAVVAGTGMVEHLRALKEAGCIEADVAQQLEKAAYTLRGELHARTLAGNRERPLPHAVQAAMSTVAGIWHATFD